MRLVSFVEKGDEQSARVGAMVHDSRRDYVLDLHRVDQRIPAEMNAFLEAGEAALALARRAVEDAASAWRGSARAGCDHDLRAGSAARKNPVPGA